MWSALLQACQVFNRVFKYGVFYNRASGEFKIMRKNTFWFYFIVFQVSFICVITGFETVQYMKSSSGNITVYQFIVNLIIWALTLEALTLFWTIRVKAEEFKFVLMELLGRSRRTLGKYYNLLNSKKPKNKKCLLSY